MYCLISAPGSGHGAPEILGISKVLCLCVWYEVTGEGGRRPGSGGGMLVARGTNLVLGGSVLSAPPPDPSGERGAGG